MSFSPRDSSGGGLWRVMNGFKVPAWLYCVAYGTRCTSFVRDGLVAATLFSSWFHLQPLRWLENEDDFITIVLARRVIVNILRRCIQPHY